MLHAMAKRLMICPAISKGFIRAPLMNVIIISEETRFVKNTGALFEVLADRYIIL